MGAIIQSITGTQILDALTTHNEKLDNYMITGKYWLAEYFSDTNITSATRMFPWLTQWTVLAGTPAVDGASGRLRFTQNDQAECVCHGEWGTWEFKWEFVAVPTVGVFSTHLYFDGTHYFNFNNNVGASVHNLAERGGGAGEVVLVTCTVVNTATDVTMKMTRDNAGNVEAFQDGVSQGTSTCTHYNGVDTWQCISTADADVDLHYGVGYID